MPAKRIRLYERLRWKQRSARGKAENQSVSRLMVDDDSFISDR
jgi:hypothetical protein